MGRGLAGYETEQAGMPDQPDKLCRPDQLCQRDWA